MNTLVRKSVLRSALYILVAAFCFSSAPVLAAKIDDASKYIESIGNKAVSTISSKDLDKATKAKKVEQLFRDSFDIDWVGKFVLGRFWRQATDDQKKSYLSAYGSFLVHQYGTRFAEYSGGSFKITGARDDGDKEYTVSMQIKSDEADGQPVLVDYRVRINDKGSFSVFDIIIEGVSMITTQRSEFGSVITNNGMDYLITQLTSKAASPAETH